MSKPYHILIKYASRSRPERFFKSLSTIYTHIHDWDNFSVLAALDTDDDTMNNEWVRNQLTTYKNLSVAWGLSKSKIDAINRDIPKEGWDIIANFSDDQSFIFHGFDQIIRQHFDDGLDWFHHYQDNDQDRLSTMYIAGKEFYDRFGYIYDPSYQSLFCDNEIQEIAQELGRYKFINFPGLFFHALPSYGHQAPDAMYLQQQQIGWTTDQKTYLERRAKRLNIPPEQALNNYVNAYKDK